MCASEPFRSLLSLDVHENLISPLAAEALASKTLSQTSYLRKLDVSRCDMEEDSMLRLVPGLAKLGKLEVLNIGGNHVSELVSKALAASTFSLTLAELLISDAGMNHLSLESLSTLLAKLSALRQLDVSRNDIGTAGCEALAAVMPDMLSLSTLDVRGCNLTRLAAEALAPSAARMQKLDGVIFGEVKLMSQFVGALSAVSDSVQDACPPLLCMKRLSLCKARAEFGGVRGIEMGLGKLRHLESLLLHDNEIGAPSSASALALHALCQLMNLRELDVGNCN
eukprot:1056108-Amphidinium_carterae.1